MKILIIAPSAITPHTIRPIQGFLSHGHSIILCSLEDPFYLSWPESYTWIPIAEEDNLLTARILEETVSYFKPQCVHVFYGDNESCALAYTNINNVILHIWGSDINKHITKTKHDTYKIKYFDTRANEIKQLYKHVANIVIDDYSMMEKCKLFTTHPIPTTFSPLGIDLDAFYPLSNQCAKEVRRRLGIPLENFVFFSPRALTTFYGHDIILEAFSELIKINKNCTLLLKNYPVQCSADTERWRSNFKQKIYELDLQSNVKIVEEVQPEHLPEYYSIADFIINLPKHDAFPITFVESAAINIPIITCMHDAYKNTFIKDISIITRRDKYSVLQAMQKALALDKNDFFFVEVKKTIYSLYNHKKYIETNELLTKNYSIEADSHPVDIAQNYSIGVAIPCYNNPDEVKEAVNSLLGQTYKNWRAIIVDDHSSPDKYKKIEKFVSELNEPRIDLLRHSHNRGISAARNSAFRILSTDFLFPFDSDDKLHPQIFEIMISNILKDGSIDIIFPFL